MLFGGGLEEDEFYRLEIIVAPCNYIHSHLGTESEEDGYESDQCKPGLKAQTEYTGPLDIIIYVAHENFNPARFKDDSIQLETKLMNF